MRFRLTSKIFFRLTEFNHHHEANDVKHYCQCRYTEDSHQRVFLHTCESQAKDLSYGYDNDVYICEDIWDLHSVVEGSPVNAGPFNPRRPDLVDRKTCNCTGDAYRHGPEQYYAAANVNVASHVCTGQYTPVHGKDGYLGKRDCGGVEERSEILDLCCLVSGRREYGTGDIYLEEDSKIFQWDVGQMLTETVVCDYTENVRL